MQIAKYYNISYEKFFSEIGMSYGNFKGKAKNTPINSDSLAIILTKYTQLNATWLITGEGEMLRSSLNNQNEEIDNVILPKEILDLIKRQAATIQSQQKTIETLISKQGNDARQDDHVSNAAAS